MLPYDINILKMVTVGDDHNAIINEARNMLQGQFDYLFVTGGLGPTHDDVTKKAFCELFSDEMSLDKEYLSQLKNRFEILSKNMPKINRSQAMLLKKADVIPNDAGSALGMHYLKHNTHVFIMPGVPSEMNEMVKKYIIPNYIKNEPPHYNPDHIKHYTKIELHNMLNKFYNHVSIEYGIKTGKNRMRSLSNWEFNNPLILLVWFSSIISRIESMGLENTSNRTAHLFATCRGKKI